MESQPKLLVWNFTAEEKSRLDSFLREIGAPGAVSIDPTQGYLTVGEIIEGSGADGEALPSTEKVVLFHEVPQKGVFFLIDFLQRTDLPRPIYAMVTEQSIHWPFDKLVEHLVEERDRMEGKSQ